jgi:uncharacterized protein (DUF2141 family)
MRLLPILLLAVFSVPQTQSTTGITLRCQMTYLPEGEGTVRVALQNASEQFIDSLNVVTGDEQAVAEFTGLSAGTYAVRFYYDANNNNKMDFNFFGFPSERFGFSNNYRAMFGPPEFADISFKLSGDTTIVIETQ